MVVAQNLLVVAVFMVLVGVKNEKKYPQSVFPLSIATICKMKDGILSQV